MDTSKEYIKMCEKAKEFLRPFWKWETGDFTYTEKGDVRVVYQLENISDTEVKLSYLPPSPKLEVGETMDWLPRQSQLQEMVGDFQKCMSILHRYKEVGEPFTFEDWESMREPQSMEQLWLAFYMKEKGKTWSGTEWVVN